MGLVDIRRKLLGSFLTKEAKDMLSKLWAFLDGKKTVISLVLGYAPQFLDAVNQLLFASGADMSTWTKVTAGVGMIIGLIHKFVKSDPAQ